MCAWPAKKSKMAESAKISFPKLNANNWCSWKQRMEWLLEREGLWEVISEAKPEDDEIDDEWKVADRKARTNIGLFLEESQFKLVKNADSAREMWRALRDHHEKATMSTIVYFLGQLCSANMSEGEDMEVHLSKMEDLFDKLVAAGQTIEEPLQIAMIFRSVPPSYHTLVQSLQSRADEDWTVALVKTRLLDEYRQRQQRSDSLSHEMRALKLDAVSEKKKICFYCKQAGHFKAECKKWLAKKNASDSGKKKSGKSDG